MDEWPAKAASKRTLMPLLASRVMNERLPEWLTADILESHGIKPRIRVAAVLEIPSILIFRMKGVLSAVFSVDFLTSSL